MRYIDKQLYYTMQFPQVIMSSGEFPDMYRFYGSDDLLQKAYQKGVSWSYNENIWDASEVKEIIFDHEVLRPLDEYIFSQLMEIINQHSQRMDKIFDIVYDEEQKIKKSASGSIKEICNLMRFHDGYLRDIRNEGVMTRVFFQYNQKNVWLTFEALNELNQTELEECKNSRILYTEIFENPDQTYEYNLLTHKNRKDFYELSFVFKDLKFELEFMPDYYEGKL